MYQPHPSQPYSTSNPGFISPPPSGSDPYRSSPIPMNARTPYTSALSPPPQSGFGVMPMPVPPNPGNGQRYHQYASRSGSARYTSSPSSPYPNHPANSPNPNLKQGYPQLPVPPQQTPQQKYKGTLAPGTIIKVGEAQVRIERYLSEGGYAHVYLTTSDRPVYPPSASKGDGGTGTKGRWGQKGYSQHCLKRIAFEDEKVWADVRREIEVMKALPSNPHLTQYLASAHSRLPSGGYEVFILMEFCSGGGIIDLLNKRLRDRLKEIEILNIFTDVCEAVAAMHHLKQPLLHRDLKIENVLSTPSGQSPSPQRPTPLVFKLCDFGSTTFPSSHPPQNKLEAESLALDLNKHTTLQYRSPEMVEPMLGWAVGLPSDVWALGVLLYKLCYYTTPFEEHGTLAIVNAKYTFPQYPVYSPKIQHLIASMLVDHPARRPSVFEVLRTAHEMSGTRPEIDYPMPSRSFPPNPSQQSSKSKSSSTNLLDFTSPPPSSPAPASQPDITSTVQPQRRGRPAREQGQKSNAPVGLPPMPEPPTLPVSSKAAQPAPLQIQVTGEQQRNDAQRGTGSKETEKQLSTDVFGLSAKKPAMATTNTSQDGFGDAFGMPRSGGVAGISQRFGGAAPARSGTANSGFSDSFTAKPSSASTSKTIPRVSSPEAMVSSSTFRQASTSTDTNGDISFETRFPSVDTLNSSDDAFTPIASPPETVMSPPNLISPISSSPPSKPLLQAKASMMGHLTGEMANKHLNPSLRSEGGPQPRSTQVTGTAFKGDMAASPASKTSELGREGYFSLESNENNGKAEQAVSPPDLMTGDAYLSMTGSRQDSSVPSIALQDVTTPSASASTGPSRPMQSSRHSRPDLPTLDTVTTARGVSTAEDSAPRIPRSSPQSMKTQRGNEDSSDEDLGPESASGMHIHQSSPSRRQGGIPSSSSFSDRKAAFESSSSLGRSQNKSPSKQSSTPSTLPKPPIGNLRQLSSERVRPQSMFIPNSASRPLISPVSETPQSANSGPSRPSHARKGSINDILTKYEALQSPSAATAERKGSSDGMLSPPPASTGLPQPPAPNGVSRKPSVASKPQSLRKPTAESNPVQTGSISPEKHQSAFPPKTDNVPKPVRPKPTVAEKPILAQRPSKHGDMPVVTGWSKSSSGRSFPICKPATSTDTPPPRAATPLREGQQDSTSTKGARSGSGSPEKQQSVGSLIARWNQTK